MMSSVISALYILIIAVFLAMGAAIIFHMLYYRINRLAARTMFIIYTAGAVVFLLSNIAFFRSVDWYQIFTNLSF